MVSLGNLPSSRRVTSRYVTLNENHAEVGQHRRQHPVQAFWKGYIKLLDEAPVEGSGPVSKVDPAADANKKDEIPKVCKFEPLLRASRGDDGSDQAYSHRTTTLKSA